MTDVIMFWLTIIILIVCVTIYNIVDVLYRGKFAYVKSKLVKLSEELHVCYNDVHKDLERAELTDICRKNFKILRIIEEIDEEINNL